MKIPESFVLNLRASIDQLSKDSVQPFVSIG